MDMAPSGLAVLIIALAGLAAVLASPASERLRIPAPAFFLLAAAAASDLWPRLGQVPFSTVEQVVTVALAVILFDGGMGLGWRRLRGAALPIVGLGTAGTLATAGGVAALAHLLFGMDWRVALLLGAALAPTDPAVVFSVLGRRQLEGRGRTILEGESGSNDPVSIGLLAALLTTSATGLGAAGQVAAEMVPQLAIGLAAGAARRVGAARPDAPGRAAPRGPVPGAGAGRRARHLRRGLGGGRVRLPGRERLFVLWAGLKGAVPILLGVFLVEAGVPGARRLYQVIFVVVTFSVIVQGGTLPWLSRRLRLPERDHGPFPPLAQGAFTPAQHGVTCHQHVAASLTTPRAAGGDRGMRPPGIAATTPWADVLSDLRERRRP